MHILLENFKNYIPLKKVNKKISKVNTKSKSGGFFQKVMKLPPQASKDASSPKGAEVWTRVISLNLLL